MVLKRLIIKCKKIAVFLTKTNIFSTPSQYTNGEHNVMMNPANPGKSTGGYRDGDATNKT